MSQRKSRGNGSREIGLAVLRDALRSAKLTLDDAYGVSCSPNGSRRTLEMRMVKWMALLCIGASLIARRPTDG
jgi:hypothetical protein